MRTLVMFGSGHSARKLSIADAASIQLDGENWIYIHYLKYPNLRDHWPVKNGRALDGGKNKAICRIVPESAAEVLEEIQVRRQRLTLELEALNNQEQQVLQHVCSSAKPLTVADVLSAKAKSCPQK